jgi:hypothetical protein
VVPIGFPSFARREVAAGENPLVNITNVTTRNDGDIPGGQFY